jgi:hypothetical protein
MLWHIYGVEVQVEEEISYDEALCHVLDELVRWQDHNKTFGKMLLRIVNEKEVEIQVKEVFSLGKIPFTQIDRLTGKIR